MCQRTKLREAIVFYSNITIWILHFTNQLPLLLPFLLQPPLISTIWHLFAFYKAAYTIYFTIHKYVREDILYKQCKLKTHSMGLWFGRKWQKEEGCRLCSCENLHSCKKVWYTFYCGIGLLSSIICFGHFQLAYIVLE